MRGRSRKESKIVEDSCINSYQIMGETNSINIPFNTKQIKLVVSEFLAVSLLSILDKQFIL